MNKMLYSTSELISFDDLPDEQRTELLGPEPNDERLERIGYSRCVLFKYPERVKALSLSDFMWFDAVDWGLEEPEDMAE